MPTQTPLRDAFHEGTTPTATIDTKRVIARSRRRRLPRQVGAGSVFTLAIAGIGAAGAVGLGVRSGSSPSGAVTSAIGAPAPSVEYAAGAGAPTQGHGKRIPAEGINVCGQQLAVRDAAANGLVLTAHFPYVNATAIPVEGVVTLTNTGDTTVDGWSIDPTVTLSQGGTVLWHGTTSSSASGIETHLAPGESANFATEFLPVVCSSEEELTQTEVGSQPRFPTAPAGEYQVSAAMDMSGDAYDAILVTGPAQTITLK